MFMFALIGMYVESVIDVAKLELGWECDYLREAECARRFRTLLEPFPEFYVPEVIGKTIDFICLDYVADYFKPFLTVLQMN